MKRRMRRKKQILLISRNYLQVKGAFVIHIERKGKKNLYRLHMDKYTFLKKISKNKNFPFTLEALFLYQHKNHLSHYQKYRFSVRIDPWEMFVCTFSPTVYQKENSLCYSS